MDINFGVCVSLSFSVNVQAAEHGVPAPSLHLLKPQCSVVGAGREDRRTGGPEDGRTGGWEDRRMGGPEDGRTGGWEGVTLEIASKPWVCACL